MSIFTVFCAFFVGFVVGAVIALIAQGDYECECCECAQKEGLV